MSNSKGLRNYLSNLFKNVNEGDNKFENNDKNINKEDLIENLKNSLYICKIMNFSQGFEILQAASEKFSWNLDLSEVARVWKNGCIISRLF
jgi:6-phosphogluconate dehydrogenase